MDRAGVYEHPKETVVKSIPSRILLHFGGKNLSRKGSGAEVPSHFLPFH
jgi:hypothetical protein